MLPDLRAVGIRPRRARRSPMPALMDTPLDTPQFALLYLEQHLHAARVLERRGTRWVLALADGRPPPAGAGQLLFAWRGADPGARAAADCGDLATELAAELAARS